MTPEKTAELALERCGVSWPSENSIRVLSVFLRNASRDAYEDAARIAEEYAYDRGWSRKYIEAIAAAIRARASEGK
jgi:acetyl-CoA acetyltransferase